MKTAWVALNRGIKGGTASLASQQGRSMPGQGSHPQPREKDPIWGAALWSPHSMLAQQAALLPLPGLPLWKEVCPTLALGLNRTEPAKAWVEEWMERFRDKHRQGHPWARARPALGSASPLRGLVASSCLSALSVPSRVGIEQQSQRLDCPLTMVGKPRSQGHPRK